MDKKEKNIDLKKIRIKFYTNKKIIIIMIKLKNNFN